MGIMSRRAYIEKQLGEVHDLIRDIDFQIRMIKNDTDKIAQEKGIASEDIRFSTLESPLTPLYNAKAVAYQCVAELNKQIIHLIESAENEDAETELPQIVHLTWRLTGMPICEHNGEGDIIIKQLIAPRVKYCEQCIALLNEASDA